MTRVASDVPLNTGVFPIPAHWFALEKATSTGPSANEEEGTIIDEETETPVLEIFRKVNFVSNTDKLFVQAFVERTHEVVPDAPSALHAMRGGTRLATLLNPADDQPTVRVNVLLELMSYKANWIWRAVVPYRARIALVSSRLGQYVTRFSRWVMIGQLYDVPSQEG